jgi:hypothetical protein
MDGGYSKAPEFLDETELQATGRNGRQRFRKPLLYPAELRDQLRAWRRHTIVPPAARSRLATLSPSPQRNAQTAAAGTSSVTTLNPASVQGPNEVEMATSVASRPRAIRMRPIRGVLCRASNVYQRSPR